MATIYYADGTEREVENLGWLLRNAQKVRVLVARRSELEGYLVAYLDNDGRRQPVRYEADFADYSVLLTWLDRLLFRGLPLRLTASGRGDNEMVVGSEAHHRAIANMRDEAQRARAKAAAEKLTREKSVYRAFVARQDAAMESVISDGRTLQAYSHIRKEMVTIAAWMSATTADGVSTKHLWVTSDGWASDYYAPMQQVLEEFYKYPTSMVRLQTRRTDGGLTIHVEPHGATTTVVEIIRSHGDMPSRLEKVPIDSYPDEKRFLPGIVNAVVSTVRSSLGLHYHAPTVIDTLSRHPQRIKGYAYNWHILREAVAYDVEVKLNKLLTEDQLAFIVDVIEGMKQWPVEATSTFTFPIPKDTVRLIEMQGGGFTVPREVETKFDPRIIELRDAGWTGPATGSGSGSGKKQKIKLPDEEDFLNLVLMPDGSYVIHPQPRFTTKNVLPPVPGAEAKRLIDMRKRVKTKKPEKVQLAPPTEDEVVRIGATLAPMLHKRRLAEDQRAPDVKHARSVLTSYLWEEYQKLRRRLHETQVDTHWESAFRDAIAWLYVDWSSEYEFRWDHDEGFEIDPDERERMTEEERDAWKHGGHEVLCATLSKFAKDKFGDFLRRDHVASLCGIVDPDDAYRHEIEASLAWEGIEEARTFWTVFITALKADRSAEWERFNPRSRLIDLGPGRPRDVQIKEKPRAIEMETTEHVLRIESLYDAVASCSCGRWRFGFATIKQDSAASIRARIEGEYKKHVDVFTKVIGQHVAQRAEEHKRLFAGLFQPRLIDMTPPEKK